MSGTGAQVILDPASDAARGARGVAATTHAQNTVIRDANLISNALDPVYTKGPPSLVAPMALNFMVPGSLDPRITFTRASTATYTDVNGVLQTANNDTPRWDYDPVTHALRGLLIEEARTNLVFPSVVAAPWGAANITFVANAGTAPDGSNSFTKIADTATTAPHYSIGGVFTTVASQPYTLSVYAKAGENRYLMLVFDNNAGVGTNAMFDLQTGTITQAATNNGSTGSTSAMTAAGNGVYRCVITSNLGANTTGRVALQNSLASTGTQFGGNPYAGVAGNGVYVWGAQFEQGAFPTSYIPTTAAAVTRAFDNCYIAPANTAPWFASPGGSWFAEFINNVPTPVSFTSPRVIGIHDGTSFTPLWVPTAPSLSTYDGSQVSTLNTVVLGAVSKGASNWAPGNGRICLNGGAVRFGAMNTGFATLATAGIGILGGNPGVVNETMTGYIRRVSYWPRVLADAEMQQVTT